MPFTYSQIKNLISLIDREIKKLNDANNVINIKGENRLKEIGEKNSCRENKFAER